MAATRIFHVGVVLSVLLGMLSLVAGVWAAREFRPWDGLPLGNKELIGYRNGADFRIATITPLPIYLTPWHGAAARDRALARINQRWGRPDHWLNVPDFGLSLWWPFLLSLVLPITWFVRRHGHPVRTGFPVIINSKTGLNR